VPGFFVNGWLDAFLGSLILALFNTVLTSVIAVDDDDSFYQHISERLAKREDFFTRDDTTQGVILLEIDGLSYHHMKKALADGWMPTLQRMMEEENYQLSRFDCGVPSQTSACQAGIMFGDNFDIPAFRWYDKDLGRLIVSAHDAPLINARYAQGAGLMRDISASLTILDIVRGTPALYVTWPGYDEVAHHSGPWTHDAFHTLTQYDHVIRRVRAAIEHKAPRPYELILLSDHGQSYGWTFKQRYGKSLHELITELAPRETNVTQSSGGDDGMISVSAMASELDNLQTQNMGGRIGKRVIRGAHRAMNRVTPSPVHPL